MNIVDVDISTVIPYADNPRDNSLAIEKVAESIKEFGFRVPIVLDRNNVIVAGHTRVLAAKVLGIEKIPAIYADDLTDDQIRAYRIVDNSTAELAGWDFGKLETELAGIDGIDLSVYGFAEHKIEDCTESLFMETEKPEPKEIQCPKCGEWFVP